MRALLIALILLPITVSAAEPQSSVRLHTLDWTGVERLIRQQSSDLVVVNIWTTTCGTCLAEFPHFLALRKKYDETKIALLTVNCDYDGIKSKPPSHYEPDVLTFLKQQGAPCENVLLTVPFIDFLEQMRLHSTPAVLVYNRKGELLNRFDGGETGEFSTKLVERELDRLLGK